MTVAQRNRATSHPVAGWRWAIPAAVLLWQAARFWTLDQFFRIDFKVYYGAVAWSHGRPLYRFAFRRSALKFNYPPFAAAVLRPVAALRFAVAERIWFVLSLLCVLAFAVAVVRTLARAPRTAWFAPLAVAYVAAMMPVALTLRLGQINAVVSALVVADVVLLRRDSRWAGVGTGLATGLKITPGVVIPALAAGRRWREAAVATATTAATVAVGAVAYPRDSWRYFTDVLWDTRRVGNVETRFDQRQPDGFPADFSNSIRRPIAWLPGDRAAHTAIWIAVSVVLALVAMRRCRTAFARRNALAGITVAMCAGYLISPITWGHHLFFLGVVPILLVGDGHDRRRLVAAAIAASLMIDTFEGGEGAYASLARIVLGVLVVLALPIDRPSPPVTSDDAVVEGATPTAQAT